MNTHTAVLQAVANERTRQDASWGEQNHPDFVALSRRLRIAEYIEQAEHRKGRNEQRARDGQTAWDGVLLEEVFEALSESNPGRRRAELIQVAAVAVAWIEALDRRSCNEAAPATLTDHRGRATCD